MSDDLFEKYLLNGLSPEEAQELKRLLADEAGARRFVHFVQEWSLTADISRQMAAARALPVKAHGKTTTALARGARARLKPRGSPAARAWGWWAAGLAASILALFAALASREPVKREDAVAARSRGQAAAPGMTAQEDAGGNPAAAADAGPSAPRPVEPAVARKEQPETNVIQEPPPAGSEGPLAAEPARPPLPAPAAAPAVPVAEPVAARTPEAPKPETATAAASAAARVERLAGEIYVLAAAGRDPAREGQPLAPGQGLQTVGPDSLAVVAYADGTRLELGGDTTVRGLSDSGAAPGAGKRAELAQGALAADVFRQPPGRPMTFTTPHAEATVLGTRLRLSVAPAATRLEVQEGRVRFTRRPDGAPVEVKAGFYAVAAPGLAPQPKPVDDGPAVLLVEDFENANAVAARWRPLKSGFPTTLAGRVDVEVTPRPGAGPDEWPRAGGAHSRAAFRRPLRVSVDVEVTHRHENVVAALLLIPLSEKPYDKNTLLFELRGESYQVIAEAQPLRQAPAPGDWPRRERWTVELDGDEARMSVGGKEVLRVRHGRRLFEGYRIGLEGNAKSDAPREVRVRFDNLHVEGLKP